jgi:hypothetical protein
MGLCRALALEAAALVLLPLTFSTWFAGWPAGIPASLPAFAFLLAGLVRFAPAVWATWLARSRHVLPHPETLACLALAVAYRFPALVHPWGWVNKDGAFGAFIAMHLLDGMRPAPVFTEGANYQGSLKGHLSAGLSLLTGSRDFAWLMVLSSVLLYLVFVAVSMALARRIRGRVAAAVTGLYLALSPKFLTTFSLNCVGQYVDVLAFGGAALVVLATLLEDEALRGSSARLPYLGLGLLLGAAFWQQPVALVYVLAAFAALALRPAIYRDPWTLLVGAGLVVGALPALLWNVQNGWASSDILGRDPGELIAQAEALPTLVARTLSKAFPILAGLSPGHPASGLPGIRVAAMVLLPVIGLAFVVLNARELGASDSGRPSAALLPVLLAATTLALFWATAAGSINKRPRYLLPALAAFAIMLGGSAAWAWTRSRLLTGAGLLAVLALNVSGTVPRLRESAPIEAFWKGVVHSLDEKGIRTGYSDFSVSAPVTMFTAERITLSARLGPTPAYHSDRQDEKVIRDGPDAYVLPRGDDPSAFATVLRGLGATCRYEPVPFPTFWDCSRRVGLHEVIGFRGDHVHEASEEE